MKPGTQPFFTFDDTRLPVNDLSPERILQIEKVFQPLLDEMLEKLRHERPELFRIRSRRK